MEISERIHNDWNGEKSGERAFMGSQRGSRAAMVEIEFWRGFWTRPLPDRTQVRREEVEGKGWEVEEAWILQGYGINEDRAYMQEVPFGFVLIP